MWDICKDMNLFFHMIALNFAAASFSTEVIMFVLKVAHTELIVVF